MRFWRFTKGFFLGEIREFEVFFWSIVFPILLYFFLSAVLGGEGRASSISFELGVVKSVSAKGTNVFDQTIKAISDKEGPFKATIFPDLESALEAMKRGKQDVVAVAENSSAEQIGQIPVSVHYLSGRESSQVAANVLEIALDKANIEVARNTDPSFHSLVSESEPVKNSVKSRSIAYKDYIFPSVALMMILSVALFNSPLSLSFYRSSGTNKKIFTTPLRPLEYFGAHLTKLVFTMLISLTLLYAMAYFFYNVRTSIFSPAFFFALLLGMVTLVSFGLMLASLTTKESTAGIFGQVFYQTMMFLGGFFFPVFGLPWGIRWLVYLLPSTYLVELLRRAMGVSTAPLAIFWLIAVPLGWMALSVTVFSLNFRKVMGNE